MTISRLFVIAAVVCFILATLMATAAINGGNWYAWMSGGLALFAAAHAV